MIGTPLVRSSDLLRDSVGVGRLQRIDGDHGTGKIERVVDAVREPRFQLVQSLGVDVTCVANTGGVSLENDFVGCGAVNLNKAMRRELSKRVLRGAAKEVAFEDRAAAGVQKAGGRRVQKCPRCPPEPPRPLTVPYPSSP